MTSRSFGSAGPSRPHLMRGGGLGAEIEALRADIESAFVSAEVEISGAGETFVFKPDAANSGRVFGDWESLYEAYQAAGSGAKRILFDTTFDDAVIPEGVYALGEVVEFAGVGDGILTFEADVSIILGEKVTF